MSPATSRQPSGEKSSLFRAVDRGSKAQKPTEKKNRIRTLLSGERQTCTPKKGEGVKRRREISTPRKRQEAETKAKTRKEGLEQVKNSRGNGDPYCRNPESPCTPRERNHPAHNDYWSQEGKQTRREHRSRGEA